MNFDDLQAAWDSDKGDDIPVPGNLERLKTVKTPVERIRRNMRNEFVAQVVLIVIMGFFPSLIKFHSVFVAPYYIMYTMMVALSIFYFSKFYFFYKRLNTNTLNSKDNLYEVYYDIKLNIEIYKAFSFSLIPIMIVIVTMILANKRMHDGNMDMLSNRIISAFITVFCLAIALTIALTELWVKQLYGKYLKQIKRVLQELKEE
ncbi:hypothetical protein [Chitinophaga japonensis]|uniref:Uncharacterized protein n=1 Tax=Chitinophaga japonensis TaxID=104662 RepID=A0A562TFB4_CHIJA|nr:hypothetical protein [Chitinophaga japonensis]TWI92227.1 hypothetical protein LX66_1612 [Chitinophaga japonensis]